MQSAANFSNPRKRPPRRVGPSSSGVFFLPPGGLLDYSGGLPGVWDPPCGFFTFATGPKVILGGSGEGYYCAAALRPPNHRFIPVQRVKLEKHQSFFWVEGFWVNPPGDTPLRFLTPLG